MLSVGSLDSVVLWILPLGAYLLPWFGTYLQKPGNFAQGLGVSQARKQGNLMPHVTSDN